MQFAQIRKMDISNGPGIGVSLFTQGCILRCKGCHNQDLWDYEGGTPYTKETEQRILTLLDRPHISRLSILGGEPLLVYNLKELARLLAKVPKEKDVWLYTGYTLEALKVANTPNTMRVLMGVDYLVDGPFIQEQKDITLAFRGSRNQRIWYNPTGKIFSKDPSFVDVTDQFDKK